MTNKEKALKRERVRLRKSQNPQQVDYKKMDKRRTVKTEYWKTKAIVSMVAKKTTAKVDAKKTKPEKEKKKKEKEPELEVIEAEPETEEIDEELEDLYSYDDDLDDDDESEEDDVEETSE